MHIWVCSWFQKLSVDFRHGFRPVGVDLDLDGIKACLSSEEGFSLYQHLQPKAGEGASTSFRQESKVMTKFNRAQQIHVSVHQGIMVSVHDLQERRGEQ